MRTMELGTRFPKEYEAWEKRRIEIEKRFQKTTKQRQEESHEALQKESEDLESKVREAAIDKILEAFPLVLTVHLRLSLGVLTFGCISMYFRSLRHNGFSISAAPANSIPVAATGAESPEAASGGTAGKPESSHIKHNSYTGHRHTL